MRAFLILAACATLLVPSRDLHAGDAAPAAAFSGSQGNYAGFVGIGDGNFLNTGVMVVVVQPTGTFTANFIYQGIRYPIVGKFKAADSSFDRQFAQQGAPGVRLFLHMVLDPPVNRTIQVSLDFVQNGSPIANASGELNGELPDATAAQTYGGTINTSFIDHPNYGETPQDIPGDGFSISRVSKSKGNAVRFVGRLPDTTSFSGGSLLRGKYYTFYNGLYRGIKGVGGNAYGTIDASDPTALFSTVLWAKRPGADAKFYAAGFNTGVGIITSGFSKSVARVVPIPHISTQPGPFSATLTLKDGNIGSDITATLKFGFSGVKVIGPNPRRITVKAGSAGLNWAGTLVHPVTGRITGFHGGFTEAKNNVNGEGRGNFKGSVTNNSLDLAESGSARITVNP